MAGAYDHADPSVLKVVATPLNQHDAVAEVARIQPIDLNSCEFSYPTIPLCCSIRTVFTWIFGSWTPRKGKKKSCVPFCCPAQAGGSAISGFDGVNVLPGSTITDPPPIPILGFDQVPIPEPSSIMLAALALVGLVACGRRRRA